jgi:kexin
MLDDADDDEDGARTGMLNGGAGGRRGRARRGGELYDAFAGESDEDLLSDTEDEEGPYRDREEREFNEKAESREASDTDAGGSNGSGSSAGKRQ